MQARRKVIVSGDGGVGKTSFVQAIANNAPFSEAYVPTLGVSVSQLGLLDIWDLAGEEKYGGHRDGYLILGAIAVLFFDVTNRDTFLKLGSIHERITTVSGPIPTLLVGCKHDIPQRDITDAEAIDLKEKL